VSKNFKDCQLKGAILRGINSGSNTAKTIYAAVKYPHHIDSLYRELNFLHSYGYISRTKLGSHESSYSLTKKGLEHARNPFICTEFKRNRINNTVQNLVAATLEDDGKFKEAVQKYANEHFSRPVIEVNPPSRPDPEVETRYVHSGQLQPDSTMSLSESTPHTPVSAIAKPIQPSSSNQDLLTMIDLYQKDIETRNDKIADLKEQISELKGLAYANSLPKSTKYIDRRTGQTLEPEQIQIYQQRQQQKQAKVTSIAQNRLRLAKYYYSNNYLLDAGFFDKWGNVFPYWIKGLGWFKIGSVEIMSPNNKEIIREHTKGKLNPQQIMDAQFQITKGDSKGIWIIGYGMKEPYYMRY